MRVRFLFLIAATWWANAGLAMTTALSRPSLTVSGLSSGAFMATQMIVAHSDRLDGAASIAGGIYGCAKGDSTRATGECMKSPEKIVVAEFSDLAKELAAQNKISSLENLKGKPVYLFHGSQDAVILPTASEKSKLFFEGFGSRVIYNNSVPANHSLVSPWAVSECGKASLPWINKCKVGEKFVDTVSEMFTAFYGTLKPAVEPVQANLSKIAQVQWKSDDDENEENQAPPQATLYIPTACQANRTACAWHIAFHGCLQNPDLVFNDFFLKTGYAAWAESNNVVVLFPAVRSAVGNPNGCWDWWGYTNVEYLTRDAAQMTSVFKTLYAAGYPSAL